MMTLHYSSPTNIYNWKNGKYLPNADSLVKLAYIFGCDIKDILVIDYPEGENK
jgi:DNA-binding XRE family transcriptional regulator